MDVMGVEEDEREAKGEPIWKNFDYGLEKLNVGKDHIVYVILCQLGCTSFS